MFRGGEEVVDGRLGRDEVGQSGVDDAEEEQSDQGLFTYRGDECKGKRMTKMGESRVKKKSGTRSRDVPNPSAST